MTIGAESRRRLRYAAVAAGGVLVLLALLVVTAPSAVDTIDGQIGEPLAQLSADNAWLDDLARAVAAATRFAPMVLAAVLTSLVLAWKGFRRPAWWILVMIFGAGMTTYLLKLLFGRERPDYAQMSLRDFGFPSGHATYAGVAAGVAIVLAVIFIRRRGQRRLVAAAALTWALLIGLDRLLLGVHGVIDVLAGYAVAALWVCAGALVADPTPRSSEVRPMPTALPTSRALGVVLNPAKVEDPAAFKVLLTARALELGWSEPRWYETTVEDTGRSMAHDAAMDGADLVVVCGGDGTVRTVCGELAGTGIPVGVVPAGTGNLLARNLNLPLYLNAAIDVALNGQDRAIDLVRIAGDGLSDSEHFLVMAGMGFDAAIMEGANDQIKAKVGWLAYVVSGLRHLMFPAIRIEVSVDDAPFTKHRARTVVVGNVGFLQAGLPLLPEATIDDGVIDVVLLNPRRFLHWLLVVWRVLGRGKKTDDTVNRMTGRKVVIRAAHDAPRQVDGDPIGAGQELICECLPGKLLVRAPR